MPVFRQWHFSPSANVTAHGGKIFSWDHHPIQAALSNGLLPVIHGDVVFDDIRGGTILSTEDFFDTFGASDSIQIAILLAGLETGVWADFPSRDTFLQRDNSSDDSNLAPASRGG